MGRLSASGARLHELRQPKPNNAAFRQSRPPRSHGSSLGPEHPQRAIPPACREGPTLGVDVIGPPPVPPAQRKQEPPRRVRTRRGGQGERSPPPPLGTPPAACPLKRRGAVARDAPLRAARAASPQNSGRHRLSAGNSVGMPRVRAFANPAPRAASRAYRPASRARRPCIGADRGNPGKGPAALQGPTEALRREQDSRVGRLRRACRTPAALPIAARGRACPKGPENGLGAGSCADASAQSAMRHRMRRRKGDQLYEVKG